MKKTSLRQLVQSGVITNISKLRENSNSYPFVTVLTQGGKSLNLYFGQKTSTLVMDNFAEGDSILEFLADAEVVETVNAQGEKRYKISVSGTSDYSSQSKLAEIFGLALQAGEFDLHDFKKQFEGKRETITKNDPAQLV